MVTKESKTRFVVTLPQVEKGTQHICDSLPPALLESIQEDCEYPLTCRGGRVDVSASAAQNGVHLEGQLTLKATAPCNTCLAPVPLDLTTDIDLLLCPRSEDGTHPREECEEFEESDLDTEYFDNPPYVIDSLIRDYLMIEVPLNPRCHTQCRKLEGLVTADEMRQRKTPTNPGLAALANISISKEN